MIIRIRHAGHDVVTHRAVEQEAVLGNVTDVMAQVGGIDLAAVGVIHEDGTRGRFIQTEHEPFNGAFAGADAADDRDVLAGPDPE